MASVRRTIFGRVARSVLEMGPRMVSVTSGADGALLATAKTVLKREAFTVRALDTTGAGDVFCGAMIHGLLGGWSADRILPFAMAAAAIKCQGIGNRAALPKCAEVERFIDKKKRPPPDPAAGHW